MHTSVPQGILELESLTWISITNIMVVKPLSGAPNVSRVVLPGQSHISRGMMVLSTVGEARRGMPFQ